MTKFQIASGHEVAEWKGGPNVIVRIVDEGRDVPVDPDDARMLAIQLRRYADAAEANANGVSIPELGAQQFTLEKTLTEALVAVEWAVTEDAPECLACNGARYDSHTADCPVDAALTAAGLPTQELRDAMRKELAKR